MEVMDELEEPRVARHKLTVEEYYRMAEVGVLAHDARVELIEGEVIDMAPIGSKHYSAVARLHRMLQLAWADKAMVVAQSPLRLSKRSEPEPDIVVLKPRDDFYASALPTGPDSLLVVEVSDTTLAYDVRIKAPLYARHGVPEYWVFDLSGQRLRIFRQPQGDTWTDVTSIESPALVALPGLPGITLNLEGLL